MDHFSDLRQLTRDIQDKLEEKKIILLYAYNGVGKTRLSMEFKYLGKVEGGIDTLYL